ncbi:38061_t:CDS:2, partial [Gigaspora margarita]
SETRKQLEDENSFPKLTINNNVPSLPTPNRTSLIMPTLTKRFSVLRRGEATHETSEKETDSNDTQVSDTTKIYNIDSSQLQKKSARSPLSNLVELREDESILDFPISSTSPNSVITPSPASPIITNDTNQEISDARKFYGADVTSGYQSYPIQQGSIHDPSKSITNNLSYSNDVNNINSIDDSQDTMINQLNIDFMSNDQKIIKGFNDQNVFDIKDNVKDHTEDNIKIQSDILEISTNDHTKDIKRQSDDILDNPTTKDHDILENPTKDFTKDIKIQSDILENSTNFHTKDIKRQSDILENPTKDRPYPPRTRPPSLSPIKLSNKHHINIQHTNSSNNSQLDIISKDSFQSLTPIKSTFSSNQLSPTFNTFNISDDDNDIHSRSPLDRLSDGLLRLSQSSAGKSLVTPLNSPENDNSSFQLLSRESLMTEGSQYSDANTIYAPSTTSIYHADNTDFDDFQGGESLINNKQSHITSKQLTHPNSISSNNSFSDRDSSTIVQSPQSPQHMNIDQQQCNDANVRIGYAKQQAAPLYTSDGNYAKPIMIQLGGKASIGSQKTNPAFDLPVKRALRTVAPPKPQPPPLSLTDTLIASGQSDIAHQVMIMRRVQNANENLNLQSSNSSRKWTKSSKNNTIKSISSPQLVSTSSNIKAVPIVNLGNEEEGKNTRFRRKFSLRETDTSFGKSLKKIKDAFTNDNETNKSSLFGSKKQKYGPSSSQNSFLDNLPRKFVSEENLNQKFNNSEKKGFDLGKRRAYSTRENRPNEALRQDIRNNFSYVMNEKEQKTNSEYIINDDGINNSVNSVQNFTTSSEENIISENLNNNYPGNDSDIIEESMISKGNELKKPMTGPLYDIDALKRHAEMVSRYSSNKREQSTSSIQSSQLARTESISSSLDKKLSQDNILGSIQDMIVTNDEQEINTHKVVSIISNSDTNSQISPSIQSIQSETSKSLSNEPESIPSSPPPSPYSPVSLISPFSDAPSGRGSPPPISPRNPLRNSNYEKRLQKKTLIKRNDSTGSNISSGSDEKHDSRDSGTSSKFMSKVIRRTIIITKPILPPLPEDLSPNTNPPTPPSPGNIKFVSLVNRRLTKKKIIHLAADGRKWLLSKREKEIKSSQQSTTNTDDMSDTNSLNIPIPQSSLYRTPTPIPSPNTRDSVLNSPYGIPIPPIPEPHRQSISSKRTSKSSTYSSNSKYRKSIGAKSNYSGYGESLYDCYNYSDQEAADDEGEENGSKRYRRDTDAIDPTQWSTIKDREFGDEDAILSNDNIDGNNDLLEHQHVEVLEMSDGSFLWQVISDENLDDHFNYYYNYNDDEDEDTYPQTLSQDLEKDNGDLDDNLLTNSNDRLSHLDYYYDTSFPSPLHVPGVMPRKKLFETDENFIPSTSIYFANDIPLPKLLGEMTKGLGNMNLNNEDNDQYAYGGEIEGSGTGIVAGMTVEEHLDQVMRALGVDEKEILY